MVDLQGRVFYSELDVQQPFELTTPSMAVLAGPHEDVRRKSGEARRDRPDVEVVDLDDEFGIEHTTLQVDHASDAGLVEMERFG